jgi:hypothetical protein
MSSLNIYYYVCMYKGWAIKSSPCTSTFDDLLCFHLLLTSRELYEISWLTENYTNYINLQLKEIPPPKSIKKVRPLPRPLWHLVTSLFFTVRSCYPRAQPPSWRTIPSRLFATAYSISSQLPSIAGGRLLHPQPEDALCRGDKGPT